MKNSILLTGVIVIFINTTAGIIFQDYSTHKIYFSDLSITLSTGLLYFMYQLKTADGFKIGFSIFFIFSGLVRFICSIISPNEINNNIALLIFIIFLAIEIILFFVSKNLNNK